MLLMFGIKQISALTLMGKLLFLPKEVERVLADITGSNFSLCCTLG